MAILVKKFGGSSVATPEKIHGIVNRVLKEKQPGDKIVIVVSAMGDSTDDLLALAGRVNPEMPKRELDMLLATGEQTSVALAAMAINELGVPAVSLNAFQVAMRTTAVYGNARLKRIDTERIRYELSNNKIVLVTGFQGINQYNDYTTLGRGGSDTTAVALAAALNADACEIYTDVDGVYTADPRIVKNARKMDEITYDEMLELASFGAGVLHNRSVEMAKKYGVQLVVRSSLNEHEGTIVREDVKMEKMLVSGVACDKNVTQIALLGLKDKPGVAFKLFQHLANHNVNVDMILQSVGRDGTKDISFTVTEDMMDTAIETIKRHEGRSLEYDQLNVTTDVAKISVVGAGMMSNPGVAAKMFEAIYDANVNIMQISTSEIRVTVLIDEKYSERALNSVHDAFGLAE